MTIDRLLLDQMLPADVAEALRKTGRDVVRLCEIGLARATDDEVLREAVNQDRVLVTLDGHFGDWAVLPLSTHPGVIRVKADPATSEAIINILLQFLGAGLRHNLANTLVVVSSRRTRWIQTGQRL